MRPRAHSHGRALRDRRVQRLRSRALALLALALLLLSISEQERVERLGNQKVEPGAKNCRVV